MALGSRSWATIASEKRYTYLKNALEAVLALKSVANAISANGFKDVTNHWEFDSKWR